MLHIVKLIERRFPDRSGTIVNIVLALCLLGTVLGVALLFLK